MSRTKTLVLREWTDLLTVPGLLNLYSSAFMQEPENAPGRSSEVQSIPANFKQHNRQKQRLWQHLQSRPPHNVNEEEIRTHFESMPSQYWDRVTKTDLGWGLEMIHSFLAKSSSISETDQRATVVAEARHCPERGFTKVMICAWDHPGLLAKITAAFSALQVNILRAEVHTRADGIALDVFQVRDLDRGSQSESTRLNQLVFLIEGALLQPPRFASLWSMQGHKSLPLPTGTITVHVSNEIAPNSTAVQIEAPDRLGLLHDVLQKLTDLELNVVEATIETHDTRASDMLHVTDISGRQITDVTRLGQIRDSLISTLTEPM